MFYGYNNIISNIRFVIKSAKFLCLNRFTISIRNSFHFFAVISVTTYKILYTL